MSCVSQARARAGQLLFLRRNDLRVTCGGDLRGRTFCIRPLVHASKKTWGQTRKDRPHVSLPIEKHGDRHKRTVPMSPPCLPTKGPSPCLPHVSYPCLLRWTRFFDLEQVVDPGRKVFSQQSGGSDDDRHFSSGDDDHFALERPVYAFLRDLYRGDLFS